MIVFKTVYTIEANEITYVLWSAVSNALYFAKVKNSNEPLTPNTRTKAKILVWSKTVESVIKG